MTTSEGIGGKMFPSEINAPIPILPHRSRNAARNVIDLPAAGSLQQARRHAGSVPAATIHGDGLVVIQTGLVAFASTHVRDKLVFYTDNLSALELAGRFMKAA